MSVYDDMAHDAGYRGEEALEAAMRLEQEAMTKALGDAFYAALGQQAADEYEAAMWASDDTGVAP